MRGDDPGLVPAFSYASPEQRVPEDHPVRPLLTIVSEVLGRMPPRFDELCSQTGRPSIPPERLLQAELLQVLYTIRSERMLMEQLVTQAQVTIASRTAEGEAVVEMAGELRGKGWVTLAADKAYDKKQCVGSAIGVSPRTWHRTIPTGPVPSTDQRPDTPAAR